MTTAPTEVTTTNSKTDPISFHWVMTVQTNDGRQATNDGKIGAIPGVHTHETTYQAIRTSMTDLVGTDHFTVVFFSITPNAI
nr:hypothetical protein OH837_48820 [Streptomyces canus]